MVEVYGYDITRVDVDFGLYLANEEKIDLFALKMGKHYFVGQEVIEGKEVAVFLFPGQRSAMAFSGLVEMLVA